MINANFDSMTRKAYAEGISLSAIKNVLARIHNETEHGCWEETVSNAEVVDYHGIPEYRGGYMYGGWSVSRNDIMPGADLVETRHTNHPTAEPTTPFKVWEQAVKAAHIGAKLELKCSMENTREFDLVKVSENEWHLTTRCGYAVQRALDMGVTLYEGIREDVADELGVDCSSTFHACFDVAVESLCNY